MMRRAPVRLLALALIASCSTLVGAAVAPTASAAVVPSTTTLAAGFKHTCALTKGHGVRCWGTNTYGQLGEGTQTASAVPVDVTGLTSGVVTVVSGWDFNCALTSLGAVKCWGRGHAGQLGNGASSSSSTPVDVTGLGSGVKAIAAGGMRACALRASGGITCWGSFTSNGIDPDPTIISNVPTPIAGTSAAAQVAAGASHGCFVTTGGAAKCWGFDLNGELGNGAGSPDLFTPVPVTGLTSGVTSVGTGDKHTCALSDAGAVTCWGFNTNAQVGNNDTAAVDVPTPVSGLSSGVARLAVAHLDACVVLTAGGGRCWGLNDRGQLGVGTVNPTGVPVDVVGLPADTVAFGLGSRHTCALRAGGAIHCWGRSEFLELAGGPQTESAVPVKVLGLPGQTASVSAGMSHTCARSSAGAISCWGSDDYERLGNGPGTSSSTAKPVPDLTSGVAQLSTGDFGSCGTTTLGKVMCWGTVTLSSVSLERVVRWTPEEVTGFGGAVAAVEVARGHSCARTAAGAAFCWDYNVRGALGNGNALNQSSVGVPVPVTGLGSGVTDIAAGGNSACAVQSGAAWCWGSNLDGLLGDGNGKNALEPVAVSGASSGIAGIELGGANGCLLTTAGAARCWGHNAAGNVGDGTKTTRTVPVAVSTMGSGVQQVSIGGDHTCAVKTDGSAWCWGANDVGQLGVPDLAQSSVPVAVTGLSSGVASIDAGMDHTCARKTDGSVWCWGNGTYGELGHGVFTPQGAVTGGAVFLPPTTGVPAAPAVTKAVPGDQSVHLAWTAPADTGGLPLSGYRITPAIGGVAQPEIVLTSPVAQTTITGLVNGTAYTFRVAAVNASGTGALSAPTAAVVPVTPAPFGSWAALITRLHQDLVNRPATSAEIDAWTAALSTSAKTRGDLADALRRSTENTTNVDPAVRLYRAFLGRAPDRSGLEFWIARRRTGNWTLTRTADYFAASSEFKRKYGALTNEQFVTRIYVDVLGRAADPTGVAYWTKRLDTHARSRGSVMVGFSESSEYQRKQAGNTDVAVAYIMLLDRVATAQETTDWLTARTGGATHAQLLTALLESAGYATHIGS